MSAEVGLLGWLNNVRHNCAQAAARPSPGALMGMIKQLASVAPEQAAQHTGAVLAAVTDLIDAALRSSELLPYIFLAKLSDASKWHACISAGVCADKLPL